MDTIEYCVEVTPNSEIDSVKKRIRHDLCLEKLCNTRASFNNVGEKKGYIVLLIRVMK